jgi:hypothetical protein
LSYCATSRWNYSHNRRTLWSSECHYTSEEKNRKTMTIKKKQQQQLQRNKPIIFSIPNLDRGELRPNVVQRHHQHLDVVCSQLGVFAWLSEQWKGREKK